MPFKYELHCHTGEVSTCADAPVKETIERYKKAGYNGIVITDHFSGLTFPPTEYLDINKSADRYLKGYKEALSMADDDFTVLLGMEIRFLFTPNDYLIYGMTEDFIRSSGRLLFKNQKKLYKQLKEAGMLLIQAHPFRGYVRRADVNYLDGVEVFNGKYKNKEENDNSSSWAKENNLSIVVSGSDYHHPDSKINGGIETDEPIRTNDDLLRALRSGNYRLIRD